MRICLELFVCILGFFAVSNGTFSHPFRGNSPAYLRVHWIMIHNDGAARNVSVRHSSFQDPQTLWKVNGDIITADMSGYTLSSVKYYHSSPHDSGRVWVSSMKIPLSSQVDSLELNFVMDVNEVMLQINLLDVDVGATRLEKTPSFGLALDKSENIVFDEDEDMTILTRFSSENLNEHSWFGTTATFLNLDECVLPVPVQVLTSQANLETIQLREPRRRDVPYEIQYSLDIPVYKYRLLSFPSNQTYRGLLKISSGMRMETGCNLFGGVQLTKTAFIQRSPAYVFFPRNLTAFQTKTTNVYASKGQPLEFSVSALGGSEKSWEKDVEKEYPTMQLYKDNQLVQTDVKIELERLFQRDVIYRFRNINEQHAGRYSAVATMEAGRAEHSFNIVVDNICPGS